jgi:glycosyltransferase involved in cell wall biosynthesis
MKQRVESILQQTYSNLEVIILDDCSTDNSREVIESYRNTPRIAHIVYNETNGGNTFRQWAKGFALAKGEYIWIAEADDYADPMLLERLMERMNGDEEIKVGFVNSNWVTPKRTFVNSDYTIDEPFRVYEGRDFVRQHLLKENYIYNASMAVFRKDALKTVGEEYMTFRSCGDKLFWKNIAMQGKVLYVCEALNYFRIHSEKVTTNAISSGLLFREENRLYHQNLKEGFVDDSNREDVVCYFIDYVRRTKNTFQTKAIYREMLRMWVDELPEDKRHKSIIEKVKEALSRKKR